MHKGSSCMPMQLQLRRGDAPCSRVASRWVPCSLPSVSPRCEAPTWRLRHWHQGQSLGRESGGARRRSAPGATEGGRLETVGAVRLREPPSSEPEELSEYTVVLDRPLGLTLWTDPETGLLLVRAVAEGSPAAECRLIQVGDAVRECSVLYREDVWCGDAAVRWRRVDIRRMRWALDSRTAKVKLLMQRPERAWYAASDQATRTSSSASASAATSVSEERQEAGQLPTDVLLSGQGGEWPWRPGQAGQDQAGEAQRRSLSVGFYGGGNSDGLGQSDPQGCPDGQATAAACRLARLQQLREELVLAANQPTLDIDLEVARMIDRPGLYGLGGVGGSARGGSRSGSTKVQVPARTGKKKKVLPFLPWLLISSTRMDTRDLTSLASCRGLSALLELSLTTSSEGGFLAVRGSEDGVLEAEVNVSNLMSPATAGVLDSAPSSSSSSSSSGAAPAAAGAGTNGGAAGASGRANGSAVHAPVNGTQAATGRVLPSSSGYTGARDREIRLLTHAAACLQRLAFRRNGSSFHQSSRERCAVLLHCEDEVEPKIGNLLAGWLYWHRGMPLQEAILSAELALGAVVSQSLLEEATEQLLRRGEERQSQVVLRWKHGAWSVSVAGDIVGGWDHSVSLLRCNNPYGCKGSTSRGHFFLPVTGLKPGVYFYKFIVDGTWAVDPFAPKAIDNYGNYNNVFEVHPRPPLLTSKERLQRVRHQAAHMALSSKMMPKIF